MTSSKNGLSSQALAFASLNFIGQFGFALVFSPVFLRVARHEPGLYDYVFFNSYMALLIGMVQVCLYGLSRAMSRFEARSNWLVVLQGIWLFGLILDFSVFLRMGLHLDHPVVFDLLLLKDGNLGITPTLDVIAAICLGLLFVFGAERLLWHWSSSPLRLKIQSFWHGRNIVRVSVITVLFGGNLLFLSFNADMGSLPIGSVPGSMLLSHLTSQSITATLKKDFVEFQTTILPKKPNVVLVLAEAFR